MSEELNSSDLVTEVLNRLETMGEIRLKIIEITKRDILSHLGIYNEYWESDVEKEAEKLEEIRSLLCEVKDDLYSILDIIDY